ncbi:hypothetical protein GYMLUDRAFT_955896 [Collybiopsis luxurians FD-317 M1]|nr:hypothetical protein GYMLUDRAFT_955896 [Collybiopsis luxurians FD-317 M1]
MELISVSDLQYELNQPRSSLKRPRRSQSRSGSQGGTATAPIQQTMTSSSTTLPGQIPDASMTVPLQTGELGSLPWIDAQSQSQWFENWDSSSSNDMFAAVLDEPHAPNPTSTFDFVGFPFDATEPEPQAIFQGLDASSDLADWTSYMSDVDEVLRMIWSTNSGS